MSKQEFSAGAVDLGKHLGVKDLRITELAIKLVGEKLELTKIHAANSILNLEKKPERALADAVEFALSRKAKKTEAKLENLAKAIATGYTNSAEPLELEDLDLSGLTLN